MARRVIFAALLCWVFGTAWADEVERNRGTLVGFENGALQQSGLQFNYQVSFRIWAMLNEPVYNVKFTWSFDERARVGFNTNLLSLWESEDRPLGEMVSQLDPELRDTIRPYEVKVRIDGYKRSDLRSRYYVIWDVGVPGASGSTSYNTPASPKWEDMFRRFDRDVYEGEAKALMKDGFIADQVSIVSLKWHMDDYHREMDKRYPPGQKRALRRAAEKHIQLLANLQGLPRDKLDKHLETVLKEVEEKQRAGDRNFMQGLQRMVARFETGLPPEMRNMNIDTRYQEALAEIRAEKEADMVNARSMVFSFGNNYSDWLEAKRAELGARKQYATEIVSFTDPNSGRCGFKDESGAVAVPARYFYCRALKGGLGVMSTSGAYNDSGWGVLNSYGDEVLAPRYHDIEVENEDSDTPTFIITHSVDFEGGCGHRTRIRQRQRVDASGEPLSSVYSEREESYVSCPKPLVLHRRSID